MKFALLTKSCAAVLLVQASLTAYAGRPMGTDDAGARWWLLPERVALDVTTGRSTGTNSTRTTTIGLGWYGIGW